MFFQFPQIIHAQGRTDKISHCADMACIFQINNFQFPGFLGVQKSISTFTTAGFPGNKFEGNRPGFCFSRVFRLPVSRPFQHIRKHEMEIGPGCRQ
jgi:hypothetical protein